MKPFGVSALEDRVDTPRVSEALLVFAAAWCLFAGMQFVAGSYTADLGGHSDESGHYVTGLMVRQYLQSPSSTSPVDFAMDYYQHYPKIGIGKWPPLMYLVFGVWTLAFGTSKFAAFTLLAILGALICAAIYSFVVPISGRLFAALAAAVWAFQPSTADAVTTFMAEVLVTALCFAALWMYSRFLTAGTYKAAVGFGLLAGLAILTKGTAISLAFVPPLGAISAHRIGLLRRLPFWSPLPVAFLVTSLWYLPLFDSSRKRAIEIEAGLGAYHRVLLWISAVGIVLLAMALWGLWRRYLRPLLRGGASPWAATGGSFLLAVAAVHIMLPESQESRHLSHAVPFVVVFAVVAASDFARRVCRWGPENRNGLRKAGFFLAALLLFCASEFRVRTKPATPYGAIAEDLLADPKLDGAVILVSSDRYVDGLLVAEIAMREPDPRLVVLRGTKMLADVGSDARFYQKGFTSPEEMADFLTPIPVAVVVADKPLAGSKFVHHRQLLKLLDDKASAWPECKEYQASSHRGARVWWVRACRMEGTDLRQRAPIDFEIPNLKRTLRLDPAEPRQSQ